MCENDRVPRKELREDSIQLETSSFSTAGSCHSVLSGRIFWQTPRAPLWVTQDEFLHPQNQSLPLLKRLLLNWALSWERAVKLSPASGLQSFQSMYSFMGKQAHKQLSAGQELGWGPTCQLLSKSAFSPSRSHEEELLQRNSLACIYHRF